MNARSAVLLGSAALIVALGAVYILGGDGDRAAPASGEALAAVTVPPLSGAAAEGAEIFAANCASCHGANAEGRAGEGPPPPGMLPPPLASSVRRGG